MSSILGESLMEIKSKLTDLGGDLNTQLKELDTRGIKWFQYDAKKEKLMKEGAETQKVFLNVGGQQFQTTLSTILKHPDTLLFNLIMTEQWDYKEELYLDRSFKYFKPILSYMRSLQVNLSSYKDEEVVEIAKEAKFYHMKEMVSYLENFAREVVFVAMEFSGEYRSGNQVAATNNVDDLNNHDDTSCMRGIATAYTGWIIIEFNREVEFDQVEIGGYRGNTNLYSSSNGVGASIKTSLDKQNWTTVGTINNSYSNGPFMHNVTSSRAKYIKFEHNSYVGIGYLRIIIGKK